jgi:hypothetical protein
MLPAGDAAKNAPNASKESPPNTSSIPAIIAKIAIIVTPSGLAIGCVKILFSITHIGSRINVF